jgi:hypothetical protein
MSALHFCEDLPGRSKNLEAPRCHGREVPTRLAIDRIVSDKTLWNATVARGFLQKLFFELAFHKQNNAFEQFETTATALMSWPSRRLIHTALGGYNLFFLN